MNRALIWASGAVGLLPGFAVVVTGLGVPPGHTAVFAGIIEALCAIVLLVVWLNQGRLKRAPRRRVTQTSILLTSLSLAFFCLYIFVFNLAVVNVPPRSPVYFPLVPCTELQEEIDALGSRAAVVERWGSGEAVELVHQCPDTALIMTTVVLLVCYSLAFALLTSAIAIPAAASRFKAPSP